VVVVQTISLLQMAHKLVVVGLEGLELVQRFL